MLPVASLETHRAAPHLAQQLGDPLVEIGVGADRHERRVLPAKVSLLALGQAPEPRLRKISTTTKNGESA